MTVTAYVSRLLRRSFERAPGGDSVLPYDHVAGTGDLLIDREPNEDEQSYRQRSALYDALFGRSRAD